MKIFISNYPEPRGAVIFSSNLEAEAEYKGTKILFRKFSAFENENELIC